MSVYSVELIDQVPNVTANLKLLHSVNQQAAISQSVSAFYCILSSFKRPQCKVTLIEEIADPVVFAAATREMPKI